MARVRGAFSLVASLLLLANVAVSQDSSVAASTAVSSAPAASSSPQVTPTVTPTASVSITLTETSPSTATSTGTGSGGGSGGSSGGGSGSGSGSSSGNSGPPDVHLKVPNLSVQRIELDVDNLNAEINLAAQVANLVTINAGVQVGVKKVNITIADVEAKLELVIRLGHLVDIVNRTLQSLNLNPLLINVLNDVTDLVDTVVGAVDGLLGSIINGDSQINFLIDNLGNIVQEVTGDAGKLVSSIVGNFQDNMTYTGSFKDLGNGLTQKTYKYSALGSLVNIVTNTLGQVVQAVVVGSGNGGSGGGSGGGGTTTTAASSAAPTTTAAGVARKL